MSIKSFLEEEGITVNVESAEELHEALDALHIQVMVNLKEGKGSVSPGDLLAVLEAAMERLEELGVDP